MRLRAIQTASVFTATAVDVQRKSRLSRVNNGGYRGPKLASAYITALCVLASHTRSLYYMIIIIIVVVVVAYTSLYTRINVNRKYTLLLPLV